LEGLLWSQQEFDTWSGRRGGAQLVLRSPGRGFERLQPGDLSGNIRLRLLPQDELHSVTERHVDRHRSHHGGLCPAVGRPVRLHVGQDTTPEQVHPRSPPLAAAAEPGRPDLRGKDGSAPELRGHRLPAAGQRRTGHPGTLHLHAPEPQR